MAGLLRVECQISNFVCASVPAWWGDLSGQRMIVPVPLRSGRRWDLPQVRSRHYRRFACRPSAPLLVAAGRGSPTQWQPGGGSRAESRQRAAVQARAAQAASEQAAPCQWRAAGRAGHGQSPHCGTRRSFERGRYGTPNPKPELARGLGAQGPLAKCSGPSPLRLWSLSLRSRHSGRGIPQPERPAGSGCQSRWST